MIEYIKNNNVQNADQVTLDYILESHAFLQLWMIVREEYDYFDDDERKLPVEVSSWLETHNIFQKCFIHDITLYHLQYFNHGDIKDPLDLKLDHVDMENDLTGIVKIQDKYFLSGKDVLSSGWQWHFCNICVNEEQLLEEIKEDFWTQNIVTKYGFEWCPSWV